jgi:1-acyl-sn-glycerol-3-phosphate acyltransferase
MRALIAYPVMVLMTAALGIPVILVSLAGGRIAPDSFLGRAGYYWSKVVLWASGVRVVARHAEHVSQTQPAVYVSNHVSWFEIFGLATLVPRFRFVAKKELLSAPVFGRAAREVAALFIDRRNRKAAFDAYTEAAEQMRHGISVCVYPEGTRGNSYELRPFKKGPFVLAIAAQVPIVPVVAWGTREVQKKGELAVHSGSCELTFLEPIPTAGLGYEDRDRLVETAWRRMAAVLEEKGVPVTGVPFERQTAGRS